MCGCFKQGLHFVALFEAVNTPPRPIAHMPAAMLTGNDFDTLNPCIICKFLLSTALCRPCISLRHRCNSGKGITLIPRLTFTGQPTAAPRRRSPCAVTSGARCRRRPNQGGLCTASAASEVYRAGRCWRWRIDKPARAGFLVCPRAGAGDRRVRDGREACGLVWKAPMPARTR